MPKLTFNTNRPKYDDTVFIAENAAVIGDVSLGKGVSIWYGACVRGDYESISIGEGSNVQDNATVHVDTGAPTNIGNNVTIGHNAVVHGATIENDVLIGMGSIVLTHAVVGRGSIVAAGAVVKEGMVVPPMSLVAGIPGKVIKEVTPEQTEYMNRNAASYIACGQAHKLAQEAGDK